MNSITRRAGALKIIIIVVVLTVLLVVGGVVGLIAFGFSQMDNLAKQGIEKGGTYALGVQTTVASTNIAFTKGTFDMSGFNVANPEGYDTAHFIDLGSSHVSVDYATFGSEALVIPELRLSAIDLNLEKKSGTANYQVILDNLKKFETAEEGKQDTGPTKSDPFQFVISKIIIEDVAVHADVLPVGGEITRANAEIDEIVLENVGTAGDPVDFGELTAIVLKAVLSSVAGAIGDLPGDIAGELTNGLGDLSDLGDMGIGVAAKVGDKAVAIAGDLGEEANKALEGATDQIEDAAENIEEGIKDATKGIGDLLGGGGGGKDKKK